MSLFFKQRAPRPGPSGRFIAIRWAVAALALLVMAGSAAWFSQSFDQSEKAAPAR